MTKRRNNMDQGLQSLVHSVASSFKSDQIGTFFGKGSLDLVEEWIPTRNKALNYVMGDPVKGAFAQGKIYEIYGPPSSAKSVIGYEGLAEVQNMGGIGILVDSEGSFHRGFAKSLGVKVDTLIYAMLETVEETYEFLLRAVTKIREKSDCPILILWDSIAASKSQKEVDTDMVKDKRQPGVKAKATGEVISSLSHLCNSQNATLVVINQIRHKIGIMYGNPETTTSGNSIGFYASVRLEVRKSKTILGNGKQVIGHLVRVYCAKNKVRPPFLRAIVNVWTDRQNKRYGLDKFSGIVDLLVADGILEKERGMCTLTANTSVRFKASQIGKHWKEHILPVLKEIDLYEAKPKEVSEVGTGKKSKDSADNRRK